MKISQIIFLGLALFLTVENTAGNHLSNCGLGSGVNPCGCSEVIVRAAKQSRPVKYADPYVIREATSLRHAPTPSGGCGSVTQHRSSNGPSVLELLKPSCGPVAPRFRPIGDLCGCKTRITEVTPAYPGRPCSCGSKPQTCACDCNEQPSSSCAYESPNPELAGFEDEGLSFDEQESIYNSQCVPAAPADAVSLSLAFGLSRQATRTVPEGSLAFGPTRTPIDGRISKTAVDIPEERLLTVARPVVELKSAPRTSFSATYQEIIAQQEALEQQRMELEAAQDSGSQASSFISYKDLGYGPVAVSRPDFISTVSTSGSGGSQTFQSVDDSACGPVGPPVPGYVSGNVIIRSDQNEDNDGDNNSYSEDGSFEYDSYSGYGSEESEPESCNGGGILARLRSSARAQSGSGYGSGHGSGHGSGCGCGCGH